MSNRRLRVFMMDLWATVPYYTAYLSRALRAEGADVMVGSITYYLDPDCFRSRGIKVDPGLLDIVGRFPLPQLPRRLLKLLEAIINLCALTVRFLFSPPDVIHVQFLPMLKWRLPVDLWFLEFFQKRGTKVVLTVHDLLPHNTGEALKDTYLDLYRRADRLICHSDHVRASLASEFAVPEDKVSVIPHGPFFYDLAPTNSEQRLRSFNIEPGPVLVLWQGIISPYKGVDLLLDAWQRVESTGVDATLVVVGTGAPKLLEQIREQIGHLDLKRVNLHPRYISSPELVVLYRAADVVVYPYRAITTSGALATGLALGKAIVANDLPVFRELLTHRENALLIDCTNATEFAGAIIELARDPALRELFAARVRAMEFGDRSWISIAKDTVQAYETALALPHTAPLPS